MPEEIFILSVVAILAGSAVAIVLIWAILSFFKSRSRGRAEGSSLTAGELQRLVRQAVEEATLPLAERLENLEGRLGAGAAARLLEEHEAPYEAPHAAEEGQAARRRHTNG